MYFILQPSLEHIALVKVTAALWNQQDVRALVIEFSNSPLFSHIEKERCLLPLPRNERKEKWQEIEDKVAEKVPQLTLPAYFQDKILGYIQSLGLQILRWLEFHRRTCCFDLELPNELFWTIHGTVDRRKTAEVIIRDESIDITLRYKLACIYCLEDYIPKFWNEISENDKKQFYCEEDPSRVLQQKLVVFWTYTIKGEMDKIGSYQYAFESAADGGNRAATEYFLQKLKPREKYLLKAAFCVAKGCREIDPRITRSPKEYRADVLCFLLSQMSSVLQVKLFKTCPYEMLQRFLDWPLQTFFVDTASYVCNLLPERFYNFIMGIIIDKIIFGCKDYDYQKMFEEFWHRIPNARKNCVLNDVCIAGLILMLLQIRDKGKSNIFKLIFQDATLLEKKKLIFSRRGQYICEQMINFNEWDLVKIFIRLCVSSKDEMIKFKQEFEDDLQPRIEIYWRDRYTEMMNKCDEFSQILDNFVLEYGENKEESDNSPAKKLCVLRI